MSVRTMLQSGSLLKRTTLHVLLGVLLSTLLTAALAALTLGVAGLLDGKDIGSKSDGADGAGDSSGAKGAKDGKGAKGAKGAAVREKKTPELSSGKDD